MQTPERHGDELPSDGPAAPAGFVWPPKPLPADGMSSRAPAETRPVAGPPDLPALEGWRVRRPVAAWRQIEETWLGVTSPPLADRLADAGVAPDPFDAYCPRCGQTLESRPGGIASACAGCDAAGTPPPWDRLVRLGPYAPPLDAVVREVKFTAFRAMGTDVGGMLGERLAAALRDDQVAGLVPPGARLVIVPVPTSFRRRISRGIDHALEIARGAARTSAASLWPALTRAHRPAQSTLTQGRRSRNVAGTMGPSIRTRLRRLLAAVVGGGGLAGSAARRSAPTRHPPTVWVVVDDVTTTGATLREATRALRGVLAARGQSGPVWVGVVAVTPKPRG